MGTFWKTGLTGEKFTEEGGWWCGEKMWREPILTCPFPVLL